MINKQRKLMGLSRVELCHKLGYRSGQFIWCIEKGETPFPVSKVKALVEVLNLDPAGIRMAMVEDYANSLREEMDKNCRGRC